MGRSAKLHKRPNRAEKMGLALSNTGPASNKTQTRSSRDTSSSRPSPPKGKGPLRAAKEASPAAADEIQIDEDESADIDAPLNGTADAEGEEVVLSSTPTTTKRKRSLKDKVAGAKMKQKMADKAFAAKMDKDGRGAKGRSGLGDGKRNKDYVDMWENPPKKRR